MDTDDFGTFEDQIKGTLIFIESLSKRKLAEFIVHQNEAIEGLTKNNKSFVLSFKKQNKQEK